MQNSKNDTLESWVITKQGQEYVARQANWWHYTGREYRHEDLQELRKSLPPGLTGIEFDGVVEAWINPHA